MLRLRSFMVLSAACLALAACGGGSGDAVSLLKQTFCGTHHVGSGNLNAALRIVPSGSHTLTAPISLSLSGPFQSSGAGQLPESDLTLTLGAQGGSISGAVISTGGHSYVTLTGSNYELPQSEYQRLESGFSAFASPPGCSSRSGVLAQLHLHPLHWLTSPRIAGNASVGGASTTQIHAGINVTGFLADLVPALQKVPVLRSVPQSILSAIADRIQNATFDVWTGTSDQTLRQMKIHLTIPVPAQFSSFLGGLTSADVSLTLGYSDLNQPQSITAPTNLQPYSQFQSKLASLIALIRSQLASIFAGGLTSSTSGGGGGGGTATGSGGGNLTTYSSCIQRAQGNVVKMQKCARLLGGQ